MAQHYTPPIEDEKLFVDLRTEAQPVLRPFHRDAPPPLQNERLGQYDRRLTYEVQKYAPNYKEFDLYEAKGDAYKLLKKQIYEDAMREARAPTNIPEGELREVTRFDQSGRPYSLFFGKCSAWMNQFKPDTVKRVAKIRNVDEERGRFTKIG